MRYYKKIEKLLKLLFKYKKIKKKNLKIILSFFTSISHSNFSYIILSYFETFSQQNILMHLETTLIIPNHNLELKTNSKSHLLNFLHPLHILKKTNNQNLQPNINQNQQQTINLSSQQNSKNNKTKKNLVTFQKKIDNFIPTQRKQQKKHTNFLNGFRQNLRNTQNICQSKITKGNQLNLKKEQTNNQIPSFFNEDEGILQHLIRKFQSQKNSSTFQSSNSKQIKESISNSQEYNNAKCGILFGFSVNSIEIQQLLSLHPEINLTIKLYKYDDSEFYKQTEITQDNDLEIEQKCKNLSKLINCQNTLNCQQITFVINMWKRGKNSLNKCTDSKQQHLQRTEIAQLYFFPNINTQPKFQENNWINSRSIQRESSQTSQRVHFNSFGDSSPLSYDGSMSSLRKSHQNFRILQVLQYYMSLECHSDHIMISQSQSLVIRKFLNSIYEKELKQFYIFIDHQSKQMEGKKIIDETHRSIVTMQKQDHDHFLTPSHTSNYLLSSAEPQFISVNGQLIINDQFLSKLSSIKPPQPCTDSHQFRKQKQIMYHMKLQQYHEQKQLRKVKKEFTQMINYLNSLIGLQKVSYEDISLQSLKTIKNAKIRQSTLELKQLVNLSQQKQIRYQDLKSKIALYEQTKSQSVQTHDNKLSILRKEITDLQKQLNLHKNQISNIYEMSSQQQISSSSNLEMTQNLVNQRISIDQQKSFVDLQQKDKSRVIKQEQKNNSTLKQKRATLPQNNYIDSQQKLSKKSNIVSSSPKNTSTLPIAPRQSLLKPQLSSSQKHTSFLSNRHSSQQFLNKYAPILQQLRKQKYEEQLKQEKTRCQFQAQKQFQKLKEQYKKATKDLLLILGDCD